MKTAKLIRHEWTSTKLPEMKSKIECLCVIETNVRTPIYSHYVFSCGTIFRNEYKSSLSEVERYYGFAIDSFLFLFQVFLLLFFFFSYRSLQLFPAKKLRVWIF